jgi:hypothetical protein
LQSLSDPGNKRGKIYKLDDLLTMILPLAEETGDYTFGAQSHARYMVVHDQPIAHAEDKQYALYSEEGNQSGLNSLIFATSQIQADHIWAMNFFASAPFHLLPMLDPNLKTVGYGHYNESIGNFRMAGVLNVRSGLQMPPDETISYPIMFPGDGKETWVLRHSLFEWPNSIPSCPSFSRPSGPPIVLMLGTGDITPNVKRFSIQENGKPVETCMFNETNFSNPNPTEQSIGRSILNERDAIVLMPQNPLIINSIYLVEIEVDGELHSWAFTTRRGAVKAHLE